MNQSKYFVSLIVAMCFYSFSVYGVLISSDLVTGTVVYRFVTDESLKKNIVDVAIGDSVALYASGGVSLTVGDLGLRSSVLYAHIIDAEAANGVIYKYDSSNNKIRMYGINNSVGVSGSMAASGSSAWPWA